MPCRFSGEFVSSYAVGNLDASEEPMLDSIFKPENTEEFL